MDAGAGTRDYFTSALLGRAAVILLAPGESARTLSCFAVPNEIFLHP